jgi:hypothetical protein
MNDARVIFVVVTLTPSLEQKTPCVDSLLLRIGGDGWPASIDDDDEQSSFSSARQSSVNGSSDWTKRIRINIQKN